MPRLIKKEPLHYLYAIFFRKAFSFLWSNATELGANKQQCDSYSGTIVTITLFYGVMQLNWVRINSSVIVILGPLSPTVAGLRHFARIARISKIMTRQIRNVSHWYFVF